MEKKTLNIDLATQLLEEIGLPDGMAHAIAVGCDVVNNALNDEKSE